ncbi:MAG: hypothetical protein Q6K99_07110 [Thermostichales cyanobacterium BF4_bins_65]
MSQAESINKDGHLGILTLEPGACFQLQWFYSLASGEHQLKHTLGLGLSS